MASTHASTTGADTAAVKADYQEYLFHCAPPYYADPLVLVEGQGSRVIDSEGREFLDFFCGILTTGIGHCHPEVVELSTASSYCANRLAIMSAVNETSNRWR